MDMPLCIKLQNIFNSAKQLMVVLAGSILLWFCIDSSAANLLKPYPFNSPYTKQQARSNTLFSSFSEPPKHLDPARSYSSDEFVFIAQIYEPPYEYHYLLRPYQLVPLSAENDIDVEYEYDGDKKNIIYSTYTIKIKPNIYYQPHPAFIKDKDNKYIYHNLDNSFIDKLDSLDDFNYKNISNDLVNTREVLANDFVYQIKRLADPKVQSPIYSFMAKYIIGLEGLNKKILDFNNTSKVNNNTGYINYDDYDLTGVQLVDKYTYKIKIKGNYPQFKYWLAMPFFAPMPWEAVMFYSQKGLKENNISLDTYPVGTGPFYLSINNSNRHMILEKNPYYKHGFYPTNGMPEDKTNGLMVNAGKKLPFIDRVIYSLEKESIPIWNKFLQGYYDMAGISSDNFDQAIELVDSQVDLSDELKSKNISLVKTVEPSVFYWGFNMLDETIGGDSERARKLRQAITIAFDVEEYINIFRNGRGIIAHSPIPSILSPKDNDNYNKYIYNSTTERKSLEYAKKLLVEAGYSNGIDPKTGSPLVINYDAVASGDPSEGARFNWMREQFEKINIDLNIRATQYNRFRDKMSTGRSQMYMWGWNADYPDPENFLFLFLCSQTRVGNNGENSSNYCNKEFDQYFEKMQLEQDTEIKQNYINKMVDILRYDNPWIFGLYNEQFVLRHGWMQPSKPFVVGNNNLKYLSLDASKRVQNQKDWNQPILWPILLIILFALCLIIPVFTAYYYKTHRPRERV